jgi:hypothetical protein
MPDERMLHRKLAEVMAAVGYIPKRGVNREYNYTFVSASDVADKVRDELAKRHVTFLPIGVEMVESDKTLSGKQLLMTLRYTWQITDGETGESITVQSIGTGTDNLDKSPYKATTGAMKYALLTTFQIPTGDDPEASAGEQPDGQAPAEHRPAAPVPGAAAGPRPDEAMGECPIHHLPWKHVPAGTSSKTGRPFDAFWSCPERDCRQRPARPPQAPPRTVRREASAEPEMVWDGVAS